MLTIRAVDVLSGTIGECGSSGGGHLRHAGQVAHT